MQEPKKISEKIVVSNPFLQILEADYEDENGHPVISDEVVATYGYIRDGNGDIYDSEGNLIDPYDLLPETRTIGFSELQKPSGIDISPVN